MNSGSDGRRIIRAMLPVLGFFPRFSCLLFACMVQVSTTAPASAEWLLVGGNGKANVYVEEETISRPGEWVRVWVMDDLKIAQPRGLRKYLSTRAQEEHDCLKERFRLLGLEYFSGNMGTGDVLYKTSGESDWAPIPRGSLAQSVWKFVCGTKK
ncbi:MAG: hypothetical protein Nkreftii_000798 [Candidatus Nitrospira kreftii]|uniref:Surface-adhesin protein E-like domain-containing protein n=1 Tax=Candidatus Nitrospira kreftii TaxID=2652173 RepID=A0A7S8FC31_9BACT|nr:MAG: hypothetical protein Nkreftii_000798 [Candidatus Nitrospira kreftii]